MPENGSQGDGAEFTVDALECTYELSEGGNILVLTTDGIRILGSMAEQEPGSQKIYITLERDLEIEARVPVVRGFFSWLGDAIVSVVTYVYDKAVTNLIEPYFSTINYEPWDNTKGWKPGNWMSLLPGDLPVCCVNIPGSHDSATASIDFVGKTVSADCQSYSIEQQYDMGAGYRQPPPEGAQCRVRG